MKRIKNCVLDIIHRNGTADPVEICEKNGIIVLYQDLPAHINGFTITMEEIPFIVLNCSLEHDAARVTMAHELGHFFLHNGINTVSLSLNTEFCINKLEREADCFAAYLLLYGEMDKLEDMGSYTAEDVSMLTHIPKDMIEDAFFG